jgi:hypothetical protein
MLGDLAPGTAAHIDIVMIPNVAGTFVNGVFVGTSTPDPSFTGDEAYATVHVKNRGTTPEPHVPNFTG